MENDKNDNHINFNKRFLANILHLPPFHFSKSQRFCVDDVLIFEVA
jgi:hypothetical protein